MKTIYLKTTDILSADHFVKVSEKRAVELSPKHISVYEYDDDDSSDKFTERYIGVYGPQETVTREEFDKQYKATVELINSVASD